MARRKVRDQKFGPGFEDAPQAEFDASTSAGKPGFGIGNRVRLTIGPAGRVVIPAAFRDAMEVEEGDTVLAWMEDGELHLLSPKVGARQAQAMLGALIPDGVSLSESLIADRRRETQSSGE